MAKKFVRGVTGVDDIEKFDKSLTNVNDLISDGQDTYVHTKKGKNEFYYKVTDGVTSVKSTDSTVTVEKSDDGTVNLKTNPQKVLEHNNLLTNYGISKTTSGNTTKLGLEYTKVPDGFDLNTFSNGFVVGGNFKNSPKNNTWFFVSSFKPGSVPYQEAVSMFDNNIKYIRSMNGSVWGPWREQVGDKSVIDGLLAKKQNNIISSLSVGVLANGNLRQLYAYPQTFTTQNGILKTHIKSLANFSTIETAETEFNFIVKINKGATSATFTLTDQAKTKFTNIITTYGKDNTVRISGCVFTLSGSTLTVSTTNNTEQNYVMTFSDII